ncbi:hypothetical protein V502_05367 [Pseudogymnoascus sp. VKM F-4520 (FW-2644)]|nr:hypothetical protein V502_05367 [Pseudogymnoascus sp. VKM F-4520 (FW-2644)]
MASFRSLLCAIVLYGLYFGLISAHTTIPRRGDGLSGRDTGPSGLPDLDTAAEPSTTKSEASMTSLSSETPKSSSTSITKTSIRSRTTTSAPAATSTADAIRTSDYKTAAPDPLPLQPRITPAFGVGGALLMISGVVFAFVGIQHRLIYVFLSAAYLASLSVTILILYVMNPAVPDATQGAYLVAITATGIVFGAGAMFFPDLTEGFGCLLGGFCLSMWLLVLKPGGLLTSTTSITIFIVAFSAAIWSTAYIPFTKPYGLIASLAFGGATVIILGIDCFSRAGLKEFWVYIWRLNDNVFPLDTNTYPVTHGIKVEIAGVIMITAVGILTQMKLWKFIKKRRDRRAAAKAEKRRSLDREEEMVGRRVEWENTRTRQQWETVYGDGNNDTKTCLSVDSGIGTMSAKGQTTPQITVQMDGIQMADLPSPTEGSIGRTDGSTMDVGGLTAGVHESNPARRISRDEEALAALEGSVSRQSSISNRKSQSLDPKSLTEEESVSRRNSQRLSTGSKIMNRLSNSSLASQKHLSAGSKILHRLSHNTSTSQHRLSKSPSKHRLTDDMDDWDRSSSIAATIDYLDSEADYEDLRSLPTGTPRTSMILDKIIVGEEGESTYSPLNDQTKEVPAEMPPSEMPTSEMPISETAPPSPPPSLRKSLLPPAPPKVATSYRTQEWAKHLSLAETPAALPIEDTTPLTPTSPSPSIELTESPAPVNPAALTQTATTGSVAPSPIRPQSAGASIHSKSPKRSSTRTSMRHPALPHAISRSTSMQSLAAPPRAYRASSSGAYGPGGALMGSPTEDGIGPLWSPHMRPGTAMSRVPSAGSVAGYGSMLSLPGSAQQQEAMARNEGSRNSLGYLNKGVLRPEMGDLEVIDLRRRELMEEKMRASRLRQDEEIRKRVAEGVWAERSLREGRGGRVHRDGLRKLMAEGKVGV